MKRRYFIGILMALLLMSSSSLAKEGSEDFFQYETHLLMESLDRDDGISNLSVSSIVEDRYGFIWMGTQDGLNRYDGKETLVFKDQPFVEGDLQHNLIQTMYYEEEAHTLWLGTYNGVTKFDIEERTFTAYEPKMDNGEGLSDPVVIAITKDHDGYMWFGTAGGLDRVDPESGEIRHYEIPSKTVRSLLTTSGGTVMVGTVGGLYIYEPESDALRAINLGYDSAIVMTIDEFDEGIYTLGLWNEGLVKVNDAYEVLVTYGFESNKVYSVLETRDGTLWAGTWGEGLFGVDKTGRVHHLTSTSNHNAIVHDVVYSLCQDRSGTLWVGTNGGGVNRMKATKRDYIFSTYDIEDPSSLDKGKVNAIYEDQDGSFWVSIYTKGINKIDSNGYVTERYTMERENLIGNQVKVIMRNRQGRLIVGTENGLARYNESKKTFEAWYILPNNNRIYDLVEDSNGNLWIGTYDEGLMHYDAINGSLTTYEISDLKVFDLFLDSRDRLWVGTNNGLNLKRTEEDTFRIFRTDALGEGQLPSNTIEDIYEDHMGRIWFATGGGVARYDEESDSFTSYTEKDGLLSNNVSAVLQSRDHIFWLATSSGITTIDEDKGLIRNLTPENGIGGWEFGKASLVDSNMNLLFTGVHGITRIPDKGLYYDAYVPDIYVTCVKVNDVPITENDMIHNGMSYELKADENNVSLDFIALDYQQARDLSYEYRVIGLNDVWRRLGSNGTLTVSRLPSGSYTFEFRALTAEGLYTEVASLDIDVQKHWYLTWFAFAIYILLLVALIYISLEAKNAKTISKRNQELDHLNLKLEEANAALEKISLEDAMTGLYNRRFFKMKMEDQLHLAIRSSTTIALIMIDLDDFKAVNDTYGHVVGDNYLKAVADVLKNSIMRSTDCACRYGGDEFIIMLYDNNIDGALMVAERVRKGIAELELKSGYNTEAIRGTVSIGIVSEVPSVDATVNDYLEIVDQALYSAKNDGKNKVTVGSLT